jgi:hypothetical protein
MSGGRLSRGETGATFWPSHVEGNVSSPAEALKVSQCDRDCAACLFARTHSLKYPARRKHLEGRAHEPRHSQQLRVSDYLTRRLWEGIARVQRNHNRFGFIAGSRMRQGYVHRLLVQGPANDRRVNFHASDSAHSAQDSRWSSTHRIADDSFRPLRVAGLSRRDDPACIHFLCGLIVRACWFRRRLGSGNHNTHRQLSTAIANARFFMHKIIDHVRPKSHGDNSGAFGAGSGAKGEAGFGSGAGSNTGSSGGSTTIVRKGLPICIICCQFSCRLPPRREPSNDQRRLVAWGINTQFSWNG